MEEGKENFKNSGLKQKDVSKAFGYSSPNSFAKSKRKNFVMDGLYKLFGMLDENGKKK